jgi:hypothetical protein
MNQFLISAAWFMVYIPDVKVHVVTNQELVQMRHAYKMRV